MNKYPFTALILCTILARGGAAAGPQEEPGPIDGRAILAAARFLSSDALGGRELGSPGGKVAALFIASRFEAMGLEPIGESFLRPLEVGQNVLARLPGKDPQKSREAVLLGAHYDHLGRGERGVFNGADDNASGVAVLLAVAEAMARGPRPDRTVLFVAFDGEEKGLKGSRRYVQKPPMALERTVLMINLDMVGRDFVDFFPKFLFSVGTELSPDIGGILDEKNGGGPEFRLLHFSASLLDRFWASSDHKPFREAKVPILFLSTSMHPDYHATTDDAEKLKPDKMARIASLVLEVVRAVDGREERPAYVESKEIITAGDLDGIEAVVGPTIRLGPMMGMGPEAVARLVEIQSLLQDKDHEWTEAEVDSLCAELRSLLEQMREMGGKR